MLTSYNKSTPTIVNAKIIEQDTSFVSDFQLTHYVHKSILKSLIIKESTELKIVRNGERFLKLTFSLPEKVTPLMLFHSQFNFDISCSLNFKDVLSKFEPSVSSELSNVNFNFDDVISMPFNYSFYVKAGNISLIKDKYEIKNIDGQLILKKLFLHSIQHLDFILHKTNNSLVYKKVLFKILDNILDYRRIDDYLDVFLDVYSVVLIPNLYKEIL